MAVQQPPPAPTAQTAGAPPPPAKSGGCAGCSFGCLGCLGVFVLIVLLAAGGAYFALVAQAQAGVAAPAALVVISNPVEVGHNDSGYAPATSGQSLDAGSSVRTGHTGHASIQFPDGSIVRVSPDTTVTIQAAQLTHAGDLKSATLQQKAGRTLNTVQHLLGGANFKVSGHSVSAEVRGTQFEVFVRPDGSNQIKVFDGTVQVSGRTTATLNAGQQIDADSNGTLSIPRPIQPDPLDPYPLQAQCTKAAAAGNSAGTVQTTVGENLAAGQTATAEYDSAGGDLTVVLCYPGSLMSLSVADTRGGIHNPLGPQPAGEAIVRIRGGQPGHYIAGVKALQVPAGGEPFAVSFATSSGCVAGNVDLNGARRETFSNSQLSDSLAQSGVSGVTIQVQGESGSSARIYYYSNIGGLAISWTIDFYAATPNLGWVLTQVTVRGINLTTQVVSRVTSADKSFSSIPIDFTVDRVYSCVGSGGDMMVVEGHQAQ